MTFTEAVTLFNKLLLPTLNQANASPASRRQAWVNMLGSLVEDRAITQVQAETWKKWKEKNA